MKIRSSKGFLLGLALIALMLATIPRIHRGYEALLALADLSGRPIPAAWDIRPKVSLQQIEFTVAGRHYLADSYKPEGPIRAGILLVHGLTPEGKNDPRLAHFAATLARANFFVLVPNFPTLQRLQLRPESIREVTDTFSHLLSVPQWVPEKSAGIAAISVAVGPVLHAKQQPQINKSVRFILAIGGYYDLPQILSYHTTGHYSAPGAHHPPPPNERAKWAFVRSNADRLDSQSDRTLLNILAYRKLSHPQAPVDDIIESLSPQGRAVITFVINHDPAQTAPLLSKLPLRIQTDIAELDLAGKNLETLTGRLILVHGRDDPIIPAAESEALARALPSIGTSLFLLNDFQHVGAGKGTLDAWRMWRAIDALLAERAAGPATE